MSTQAPKTDCTHLKLQCLNRIINRHYDSHLAESGMKSSQFALLSHIVALEPVRPSDLAHRLHLDNSTITRTLHTLRQRDWVRMVAGHDARSRHIEITDLGRSRLRRARRHWQHAQRSLAAQMNASEMLQLHALLDRFTQTLDAETVS
ncbi:MarR family winged helix-turn-helix transcriptional regulator [Salinisphaera aquimarina]|uniref:MarR family winged helix-turn-helix transcriptional regulator n=1 Tax=Salinisphaera aquimarina TaxID=2094031 RepID=A0ABV7ENS7_9GAMM